MAPTLVNVLVAFREMISSLGWPEEWLPSRRRWWSWMAVSLGRP
uniref:Uncharacterized protein n=1 Tax=Arundo donax TaxID=35708 RepID=A0A0A9FWQ8_ARUDO